MTIIDVLLLSLVEGITEFLPISSTGHLIIVSRLLGLVDTEFLKSFEIIIQLGAVLAVTWLYRRKLLQGPAVWKNIIIAFIPTGIIGLTVYRLVKDVLLAQPLTSYITIASLGIGGVLILILEKYYFAQRAAQAEADDIQIEQLSAKKALVLGVIQTLAVIPGVSRSGATIFGGMALGLNRRTAAEFSFLLAIPTMAASSGYDLLKSGHSFSSDQMVLLGIGFVASFVVAYAVVTVFLSYIQKHTFIIFGWYRIAVAVLLAILFIRW